MSDTQSVYVTPLKCMVETPIASSHGLSQFGATVLVAAFADVVTGSMMPFVVVVTVAILVTVVAGVAAGVVNMVVVTIVEVVLSLQSSGTMHVPQLF